MYEKTKHIILILFLIGMMLFCYDYYQNFNGNHFLGISELRIKISLLIIIILFVYFSLPREFKQNRKKLTIGIILITAVLLTFNINQGLKYYNEFRFDKIMTEYKNTDCVKMKEKFNSDLKRNDLKLFISGGFYNRNVAKKYGIEIFNNGSYDNIIGVGENRNCYNDLVERHFLKELKINIRTELSKNITSENLN